LQNLPADVGPAMKVTRTAAKTAHDTVLCKACGDPPIEVTHKPPLPSFQNMMMLGALLPSLSNAYMRIIEMVDAAVARAVADRVQIRFTLTEYGGIWGMLDTDCGANEMFDGAVMTPAMWRLTVRALLKVDVYGFSDSKCQSNTGNNRFGGGHPGLKDIILLMEERSRDRHTHMDHLVESGAITVPECAQYTPLSSGEQPTCLRIIDIAKRSMNDLIIP